ncbi:MAG: ABC transporter permease [Candidatus Dormibacteraeota bacterium]|nr:ABC transporter permease [Candidatus Dormibacteraeota bacterium]
MSGLWPLAWRSIRGHPLRSLLTAVAVALGIGAVLGVQITLDGLDAQAAAAQQLAAGDSGLDVRVDAGQGLTPDQVTALGRLPGVAQAVPLYEKRVVAGSAGQPLAGLTVTLVGLQDGSVALRPLTVASGRLPHRGSTSDIAIDENLAAALAGTGHSLRTGDRVQLVTSTGPDVFTIVGLTAGTGAGPAFTRSAVFVDDAAMLGTFKLGLHTPLVALRLLPNASSSGVAGAVHATFGQAVTTTDPTGVNTAPLGDVRPLLVLATLLSVIIGAGVTANSVALAALERRREIGLLRAAGASSRQVFRLFATEAVALAATGIPFGVGIGIGLGALLVSHYTPSDLPSPTVLVSARAVFAGIGAGFGAAVIGGLIPAVIAGRARVLDALRFRPLGERQQTPFAVTVLAPLAIAIGAICFAGTGGGVVALGVALFLVGVALLLPRVVPPLAQGIAAVITPLVPTAPTAAAGLVRARNRTSITAAGLVVSVGIAVAMSALVSGALTASDSWVSSLFVGDTVITSPVTQRDEVASAIEDSGSVAQASELRIFSEPVAGATVGIAGIDPSMFARDGGLDVVSPDRATALAALENGPDVLVPQQLASSSSWRIGMQLPVPAQSGVVYLTIAGIVAHSFPAGGGGESLIMADDVARTYFGSTAGGFDDLLVASRGSAQSLETVAATYGMQAVAVSDIEQSARDALQHSIGLLLALAILAVTIAMLAVVNTLVVNARQRTHELALLRAVGMSRAQALGLALSEAGILALAATLVGVAVGCIIALPILRAGSSLSFAPAFGFPGATAVVIVVAVVVAALLAALAPARRAAATSILFALRQD